MNRYLLVLLVAVYVLLLYRCTGSSGKQDNALAFLSPEKQYTIFDLPQELNEVSGIAFKDSINVLAIADEDGIIFQFNLRERKIVKQTRFAGKDDYEDLAIVGNDVYVVNSKGDIYRVANFMTGKNVATLKIKTPLGKKNDIEGLCFDRYHNSLLLAAKGKSVVEKKTKEVFSVDLKTHRLNLDPVHSLRISEIENYFKGDALEESSKKFLKALGNKNMNEVFTTSALAVHPKTHHLYMLSSVNHIIAVLDANNKLLRVIPLKGTAFIQPEGLAFAPDGRLYVSNEGRKKVPNIILLENEK